eukprot:TRINITY_DN876_c0_g1_i5.p1 TRINITY_DN876_c0_g1~~TRINITY_DN876_c0_g1_i5.p1  ORF type:complete len:1684 (+),score=240.49 TRINITY_DN876_c0_g1_i5:497-5053(+)
MAYAADIIAGQLLPAYIVGVCNVGQILFSLDPFGQINVLFNPNIQYIGKPIDLIATLEFTPGGEIFVWTVSANQGAIVLSLAFDILNVTGCFWVPPTGEIVAGIAFLGSEGDALAICTLQPGLTSTAMRVHMWSFRTTGCFSYPQPFGCTTSVLTWSEPIDVLHYPPTCSITATYLSGTPVVVAATESGVVHWSAREGNRWVEYYRRLPLANVPHHIILMKAFANNPAEPYLLVGQDLPLKSNASGLLPFTLHSYPCSNWGDASSCTQFNCYWCNTACSEVECQCPYLRTPSDCNAESYCVWCQTTGKCELYCPKCADYNDQSSCNSSALCTWCGQEAVCMEKAEFCGACGSIANKASCENVNFCSWCPQGRCTAFSTRNSTCVSCASHTNEAECNQDLYCSWCASTASCMNATHACATCAAVKTFAQCTNMTGCIWSGGVCTSSCVERAAEEASLFSSIFVGAVDLSDGSVSDLVVDSYGNSFVCGNDGGPFVAKVAPNGTLLCHHRFEDVKTGVLKGIAMASDEKSFYVVGAGRYFPLELRAAPVGVIVSISPLSVDAALMEFTSTCTLLWSVRWGSQTDSESFDDIVVTADGHKIIAASVTADFPLTTDSNANKLCSTTGGGQNLTGLLLVFNATWDHEFCSFLDRKPSSLQHVSSITHRGVPSVCAVGTDTQNTCHIIQCSIGKTWNCNQTCIPNMACNSVSTSLNMLYEQDTFVFGNNTNGDSLIVQVSGSDITDSEAVNLGRTITLYDGGSACPFAVSSAAPHPFFCDAFYLAGYVACPGSPQQGLISFFNRTSISHWQTLAGPSAFTRAVVWENFLVLGGWSSTAKVASLPPSVPLNSTSANPLLLRASVDSSTLCFPNFPSTPWVRSSTPVYPATADDRSGNNKTVGVAWPEFQFEWQEARFGPPCTGKCNLYNVSYWRYYNGSKVAYSAVLHTDSYGMGGSVVSAVSQLPFEMIANNWSWSVCACSGATTACRCGDAGSFSYRLVPKSWPDNAVGSWLSATVSSTATIRYDRGPPAVLHCVETSATSLTLTFATNHTVVSLHSKWLVFSILGLNEGQWEADSPTVRMEDVHGNFREWYPVRPLVPSDGDTWWQLGVPLTATTDKMWTISGNMTPAQLMLIASVHFTFNSATSYFYVDVADVGVANRFVYGDYETDSGGLNKAAKLAIALSTSVGFVAALLLLFAVSAIVGVLYRNWYILKTKDLALQEQLRHPFQSIEMQKDDAFDSVNSRLVNFTEFPLDLSTTVLNFGFDTDQSPIDSQLTQKITLVYNFNRNLATTSTTNSVNLTGSSTHSTNSSSGGEWEGGEAPQKGTVSFHFFPPADPRFHLVFTPLSGKLRPGEQVTVTASAMVLCTTCLNYAVPLAVCPGSKWSASKKHTMLSLKLDSQLSVKIDPDEIQVKYPPIGEGAFGTVYEGTWRGQVVAVKVAKYQDLMDQDQQKREEWCHEVKTMCGQILLSCCPVHHNMQGNASKSIHYPLRRRLLYSQMLLHCHRIYAAGQFAKLHGEKSIQ